MEHDEYKASIISNYVGIYATSDIRVWCRVDLDSTLPGRTGHTSVEAAVAVIIIIGEA